MATVSEDQGGTGMDETTLSRKLLFGLIEALEFYGDPDTYFGIAMFGDPPHGDFFDDFEENPIEGDSAIKNKPGRRARLALRRLMDEPAGKELVKDYIETMAKKGSDVR